jgi:hypothetical protein
MQKRSGFHPAGLILLILPAVALSAFSDDDRLRWEAGFVAAIAGACLLVRRARWFPDPTPWSARALSLLRRWSRNAALACAIPAVASVALRLAVLPSETGLSFGRQRQGWEEAVRASH